MSILAGTSSKTHGRLCCSVNDWVSWATVLFSHNYFGPVGAGFPVAFLIVVSQVPSVGVSFLSSKPLKPFFFDETHSVDSANLEYMVETY